MATPGHPYPSGRRLVTALTLLVALLVSSLPSSARAATAALDPTFTPALASTGFKAEVTTTVELADGKILVGGQFTEIDGVLRNGIARLNADGTLDPIFDAKITFNDVNGPMVETILVQSDGKIIIGGNFQQVGGATRNRIARLNADGTLDTGFDPGSGASGSVLVLALQPDGKIIIAGSFTFVSGVSRNRIARLNADGALDTGFDPGTGASGSLRALLILGDGKILAGGSFSSWNSVSINGLVRLNTDGSRDTNFVTSLSANSDVADIALVDDKILIGGRIRLGSEALVGRLNADGSTDAAFTRLSTDASAQTMVLQADGKILIGGSFQSVGVTQRSRLARLNADGTLDTDFNRPASDWVTDLTVQADGGVLVGGRFTAIDGTFSSTLARLDATGALDAAFDPIPSTRPFMYALHLQGDGKVLVAGDFYRVNGVRQQLVARLNANGTLDSGFNPGFDPTQVRSYVAAIATQPDGTVYVGGEFSSLGGVARNRIARLNPDGSVDSGFNPGTGPNNTVHAVAVQGDGKVMIGGSFTSVSGVSRNRIARLNADGTLDTAFNPGTGLNNTVNKIAVQGDGKVIIAGAFTNVAGVARNRVARFNADGTLDTAFDPGTGAGGEVLTMLLMPDEKVLIGGRFTSFNGVTRNNMALLNADGSLDTAFVPDWSSSLTVYSMARQPDGKIMVGSMFIARLNANGSRDTGYSLVGSLNAQATGVAVQSDGKILFIGFFDQAYGARRTGVARLEETSAPPSTPTVSLAASTTSLKENVKGGMVFTFTRTGATSAPLTVNFSFGGSAAYGADFSVAGAASVSAAGGTIVIPAGASSATLSFTPKWDKAEEDNETLSLSLTSGAGYSLGAQTSRSVTLTDVQRLDTHLPLVVKS